MSHINTFKEDDIITRVQPVLDEDGEPTGDRSYQGEKLQLVGVDAGIIILLNVKYPESPEIVKLEMDWFAEGWDFYPQNLLDKAILKIKSIARK